MRSFTRHASAPVKATPMKIDGLSFDSFTLAAPDDRPMQTALDLFSEVSCIVRTAMSADIAERHMQKIRLATGDLARYFGEVWLDSLPIEWILAVSSERVAAIAPLTRSRFGFGDRVHRFRLLQLHAPRVGGGLEISEIALQCLFAAIGDGAKARRPSRRA